MYFRRKWPWIGHQIWEDVVFLHWPVEVDHLRAHIPAPLTIDQYEQTGWLSVVFFKAKQSRLRSFSPSLSYPPFYQLNVRTYVQFGKEPGVYFFTLDASSKMIVQGGQLLGLPYVQAEMDRSLVNSERTFTSNRLDKHQPASFQAQYVPDNEPFIARKGSLENWLTERYCIWLVSGRRIMKAPISHLPWVLYDVNVDTKMDGLLPINERLTTKPIAHYAKSMTAYAHPFERFGIYRTEID